MYGQRSGHSSADSASQHGDTMDRDDDTSSTLVSHSSTLNRRATLLGERCNSSVQSDDGSRWGRDDGDTAGSTKDREGSSASREVRSCEAEVDRLMGVRAADLGDVGVDAVGESGGDVRAEDGIDSLCAFGDGSEETADRAVDVERDRHRDDSNEPAGVSAVHARA